jgi:hemolysin activation/secretion protein
LISAEQYFAGGMESVRGYRENEASGDHALRGSVEWTVPLKETITSEVLKGELTGILFYDAAVLWLRHTPAGQDGRHQLEGAGFGLRGRFPHGLQVAVDHAWALRDGVLTHDGDREIYFSMKWTF